MKKASHIILSVLLLSVTTGLTIYKHYCSGKLISTSILKEAKSCCDSDKCCKNEAETFQLDEDFSVSTNLEVPESVQINLFAFALVVFNFNLEEGVLNHELIIADSPPFSKIKTSLALKQAYLL
ncbi:MAG: hypothetical protein AB7D05_03885 [Mangrovibacterium sp.]